VLLLLLSLLLLLLNSINEIVIYKTMVIQEDLRSISHVKFEVFRVGSMNTGTFLEVTLCIPVRVHTGLHGITSKKTVAFDVLCVFLKVGAVSQEAAFSWPD
jgi:hypothetical protein